MKFSSFIRWKFWLIIVQKFIQSIIYYSILFSSKNFLKKSTILQFKKEKSTSEETTLRWNGYSFAEIRTNREKYCGHLKECAIYFNWPRRNRRPSLGEVASETETGNEANRTVHVQREIASSPLVQPCDENSLDVDFDLSNSRKKILRRLYVCPWTILYRLASIGNTWNGIFFIPLFARLMTSNVCMRE